MEEGEYAIEFVDSQDLTDPGVMVENGRPCVTRCIAVTHSRFGTTDKGGVAEDHPGLFRPSGKAFPKDAECGRHGVALVRKTHWARIASRHKPHNYQDGSRKE